MDTNHFTNWQWRWDGSLVNAHLWRWRNGINVADTLCGLSITGGFTLVDATNKTECWQCVELDKKRQALRELSQLAQDMGDYE